MEYNQRNRRQLEPARHSHRQVFLHLVTPLRDQPDSLSSRLRTFQTPQTNAARGKHHNTSPFQYLEENQRAVYAQTQLYQKQVSTVHSRMGRVPS
jgi:hypothetical protein